MTPAAELEVFADIACPFTHVGLRRFIAHRTALGRDLPVLRVRAWPLELVNGAPLRGSVMAPKVAALRQSVAPDLFAGFDVGTFPTSTLAALSSVAAAYRLDADRGEQFSLAVRDAQFELGRDVSDPRVLSGLRSALGVGDPMPIDVASIHADFREGARRGVVGSPHYFLPDADFFCPLLEVANVDGELRITRDESVVEDFLAAALT